MEWKAEVGPSPEAEVGCFWCEAREWNGHATDCRLAAALAVPDAGREGES